LRAAVILVVSLGVLHVVEGVDLVVELFLLRCLLIFFGDSVGVLDGCGRPVILGGTVCVFTFSISLGLVSSGALGIFDRCGRASEHS
jgi:hypothetical protein